ncbi:iduronate 2-sulfatase-like [Mercenaria mercenaria]|uniref:iduronate 2-sulfatase-like n=1 Tax=Mercenaria mercenaria TaxID=6596 RepID=UPI00234F8BE9|nr:iduronate 2-sulfatase-like [Mercenaria mercenaria]
MHTPNIDALASRSLLFKRAYVQQAVCSPSRTSFLTGRRPDTTHVYNLVTNFRTVGGNFTTLPEYFKMHGYRTFGIGKIFHGDIASGGDDLQSWTEPYFHGVFNYANENGSFPSWMAIPDSELKTKPLVDRQIADHAVKTLRTLAPTAKTGETKFFMAVGFRKPHLPFVFPESVMRNFYPRRTIRLPSNPYAPVNMPSIAWFPNPELRYHYTDIIALNASGAT